MPEATGRSGGGRPRRTLGAEEAVEAWRAEDGLALVVFLPGGQRALLEGGRSLGSLSDEDLAGLRERAAALTPTEAVFTAADGRRWLAQATGPAWAAEASPGLLGTRFTSLDGPHERFDVVGTVLTPPGREDADRLARGLETLLRVGRGPAPQAGPTGGREPGPR